jgi:hypothetical protein
LSKSHNLWRDRYFIFGLLALHGGTILWLLACRFCRSPEWMPIHRPLPLTVGQRSSAQFTSDLDGQYVVQVDFKRGLPFARLKQLEPPDLRCGVTAEGAEVPIEPFRKRHYGEFGWAPTYWGDTWGVLIGRFHAVPGQRYTIRLQVKQAATTFQRLDPHLEVIVDPLEAKEIKLEAALLQLPAFFLLLTALPTLVAGTCRSVRRAHQSSQENERPSSA